MKKKPAHERLYDQVVRLGPFVVRATAKNRLLATCRTAAIEGFALSYKVLSPNNRFGLVLMWVAGQEDLAEELATKYSQHLPKRGRKLTSSLKEQKA